MRPWQELLFSFYVTILSGQKKEPSKTDDVIDKPGTLFFWDEKIR